MPSFEQPAPMRSIVSDDGSCLRIRFPLKRSVFLCLFLLFWFAGWSYAGWDTIHKLLRQFDWFTLFWFGGWALGELFGLYWLSRTAAGWDLITATSGCLSLKKSILGLGLTRNYRPLDIRNMRFQPRLERSRGYQPSGIAFDHGAKTIAFANDIDEAEANQLISLIKAKCHTSEAVTPASTSVSFWRHGRSEC
jgi:hypothetical protein